MKPLQNPWIVGALAVVAVGVACYQFVPSRWLSRPAAQPAPAEPMPAHAPAPSAPASTVSKSKTGVQPEASIDRSYFQSRLPNWVDSPARDPFQALTPQEAAAASPVQQWKLKAIWRQAERNLAAINKGVYAEGDVIEGYKLVAIEDGQVWFQGATRERLGFGQHMPGPKVQ